MGGASIFLAKKYISSPILLFLFSGLIASGVIYLNVKLFVPQMYLTKTAHDYTNQQTLTWSTPKISDEYMPKDFFKPQNESEVPKNKFESDKVEIVSLVEKTQKIRAEVIAKDKTEIVINLAYFPGWPARPGTESWR